MGTVLRICAAVVGIAMMAGCTTVSGVRGPDGETAYVIRCPSSEACYARAAETCEEGYVLRSTAVSAAGEGTIGGSEVLISCKRDVPSAR